VRHTPAYAVPANRDRKSTLTYLLHFVRKIKHAQQFFRWVNQHASARKLGNE
jgi:hypothetical protein